MKHDNDPAAPVWGRTPTGALLERWPHDEAGEPENPAFLTRCTGLDMQDELLINLLGAFGVPVVRHFPHDGAFGKLMLGQSGHGVDLYVPESMLAQAEALIEQNEEAAFLDGAAETDGEEVQ